MLRFLLIIVSASSVVLCVGTCVVWVRSYSVKDVFERIGVTEAETLTSSLGAIRIDIVTPDDTRRADDVDLGFAHVTSKPYSLYNDPVFWKWQMHRRLWNFEVNAESWGGRAVRELTLPSWFVATLWPIRPMVCTIREYRLYRPRRKGLCAGCGYDLRATPERCPECGTKTKNRVSSVI
jgi:hypothetical protein